MNKQEYIEQASGEHWDILRHAFAFEPAMGLAQAFAWSDEQWQLPDSGAVTLDEDLTDAWLLCCEDLLAAGIEPDVDD